MKRIISEFFLFFSETSPKNISVNNKIHAVVKELQSSILIKVAIH
jgi:hypothetical protein